MTSVVAGLNGAGFSAADYRVAEADDGGRGATAPTGTALDELADDVQITPVKDAAASAVAPSVLELADNVEKQGEAYDAALSQEDEQPAGLEVPMMKTYKIEEPYRDEIAKLMLPQFVETSDAGLFGAVQVDLSETGDIQPKSKLLSKTEMDSVASHTLTSFAMG